MSDKSWLKLYIRVASIAAVKNPSPCFKFLLDNLLFIDFVNSFNFIISPILRTG